MIVFDPTTWTISLPPGESPIARQYDNLTRSITVTGVPEGWDWTLLVQASGKLDIIDLEPVEGGVGVTLTAQMLALNGLYSLQLRGTQGELVRHTNVLQGIMIPASLSGSATWPTVPSEFTQLEQRVQALAAETETAADQAQAAAEGVAANAQAAQEAAGQAQTAQDAAQSSAQQAGTAATAAADGAKTAADSATAAQQAAQSSSDAVSSAQTSAQTAAAQAQSAADAAQQAGQAKTAAEAAAGSAEQSAQEAKAAAAVIPTPTKEDARKVPTVNAAGDGYELVQLSGDRKYKLIATVTVEEVVSQLLYDFGIKTDDMWVYVNAGNTDGSLPVSPRIGMRIGNSGSGVLANGTDFLKYNWFHICHFGGDLFFTSISKGNIDMKSYYGSQYSEGCFTIQNFSDYLPNARQFDTLFVFGEFPVGTVYEIYIPEEYE